MTGLKKSLLFESCGAVAVDQSKRETIEFEEAMRGVGTGPIKLVLPTCAVEPGGCDPDELDRRTVHEVAVLRKPKDGRISEAFGVRCEPEAGPEAHARDGHSGGLSRSKHEPATHGTRGLSVSAPWADDREPQPRLECRHYLHSAVERVCVFGGGHGLVFPICVVLSAFQQSGDGFLSRGSRRGVGYRHPRYFQYGSGMPVYQRRFYGASQSGRSKSAWMVGGGPSTIFLWRGFGEV